MFGVIAQVLRLTQFLSSDQRMWVKEGRVKRLFESVLLEIGMLYWGRDSRLVDSQGSHLPRWELQWDVLREC